ncbi:hypothetical protein E4T43_07183 [Aureobasidium subglaciale]|nr:hypothetical protein E4T43_07183 [Aureobasidium subglaciale]
MSVIAQRSQVGMTLVSRSTRRQQPQCVSACTHIRMNRLYGNWLCHTCNRLSDFGWLYQCTSDVPEVGDYAFLRSEKHPVSPAGEELRQLGLSESIIKEFEAGGYTDEQVQILVKQKQHLQYVLENVARSGASDDRRCDFKVCQHCGPMRKERCWTSFEAVFEDEVRPIDKYEAKHDLPIKDARTVKKLGLRPPTQFIPTHVWANPPYPSPKDSGSSGYTSDGFSTDVDYEEGSCGDAISITSQDREQNLSHAGGDMLFVTIRDPRQAHKPRPTIRLVPNSEHGYGLRASPAISNNDDSPSHSQTTASSISLPTIPTTSSYTILPGCEQNVNELRAQYSLKAMTNPECYYGHPSEVATSVSSESSLGSEVAVEGGFALTEEAMSSHTPDLFTRV